MTESIARGQRRALTWASTVQWAIERQALQQLIEISSREHVPDFEAVLAKQGQQLSPNLDTVLRDGVAVIDLTGPIFRYASMFTRVSGATSIDQAAVELQAAIDDPRVRAIVLNIDSPGGAMPGISDFAQLVRSSRKPVIAFVGGTGASAAYWIAAAAGWIVVSDTALLGSIGVVSQFRLDQDESLVEIVSSQSPNKRPDLATDSGRAVVQRVVDELADVFIGSVAKYRDIRPVNVISKFGAGGVLVGRSAVRAGMADQVGTLEGVLATFARGGNGPVMDLALRTKAQFALTPERSSADIHAELSLGGSPVALVSAESPAPATVSKSAGLWERAAEQVSAGAQKRDQPDLPTNRRS